MVIGESFAYGHIPKTGGDAVHMWLAQIEGLQIDRIDEASKHHFFWQRPIRRDLYVLSIRKLPFWALSYLHELTHHPAAAQHYGIPIQDAVRPEHALRLTPDHYLLQHQSGGRKVGVWLRMEHLFDDVVWFIEEHIRPVTFDLRRKLMAVSTKGQRNYNHDVDSFFTPEQIAELYARFPVWAAVEKQIYGELYQPARRRAAA
jgi:hypothetical protein